MTVSGHPAYSFTGNMMAYKNKAAVADLEYSDTVKAYLACNRELEYAMEYLINRLEEAGILDDTVIVLTADHYPYGLEQGFEGNAKIISVSLQDTRLRKTSSCIKTRSFCGAAAWRHP